jgi:N-ethylmaleimide reductase
MEQLATQPARVQNPATALFSPVQIGQADGWRKIVDAVHARGGVMFSQLWHVGRSSNVAMTDGAAPVSASVNPQYWLDAQPGVSAPGGWLKPSPHRALDIAEIPAVVEDYRKAAMRAKAAGFDGVELHGADGYLPDQFLQDGCNKRTDAYGGTGRKSRSFPI